MDKSDIMIVNELIKLNVEKAVEKAIKPVLEHLNGSTSKKDLKEIKLLLAKLITEGKTTAVKKNAKPNFLEQASLKQKVSQNQLVEEDDQDDFSLYEEYEEGAEEQDFFVIKSKTGLKGDVPDVMNLEAELGKFDAPIIINKNSEAYTAMLESINR